MAADFETLMNQVQAELGRADQAVTDYVKLHGAVYEDLLRSNLGQSQFEVLPVKRPGTTNDEMRAETNQVFTQLANSAEQFGTLYDQLYNLTRSVVVQSADNPNSAQVLQNAVQEGQQIVQQMNDMRPPLQELLQHHRQREGWFYMIEPRGGQPHYEVPHRQWCPPITVLGTVNVRRVDWYREAHMPIYITYDQVESGAQAHVQSYESSINWADNMMMTAYDLVNLVPNYYEWLGGYHATRQKIEDLKQRLRDVQISQVMIDTKKEDDLRLAIQGFQAIIRDGFEVNDELNQVVLDITGWAQYYQEQQQQDADW